MAEHTPGPWRIQFDDYGDEWWLGGTSQGQAIIYRQDDASPNEDSAIAIIPLLRLDEKAGGMPLEGEREANARLLNAAPTMLAALEEVVPELQGLAEGMSLEYGNGGQPSAGEQAILNRATAAIAAAKGSEHAEQIECQCDKCALRRIVGEDPE